MVSGHSENTISFNDDFYPIDSQGFLKNRLSWSAALGTYMAEQEGVSLTAEHWAVIQYFREYYENYNIPPPMRMVIRVFKKKFGEEQANSRYLHALFPGGPTRTASKWGGLPKPKNCK